MTHKQQFSLRIEIGPDASRNLYPFQEPAAFAAFATAALRALTVENLYADAEFTGTKDGVSITLQIKRANIGSSGGNPSSLVTEINGEVTLKDIADDLN